MNSIDLRGLIIKNANVKPIVIDQDMVLMDPNTNAYFNLNAVGAKIWALFEQGPISLEKVANFLQQTFHLSTEQSITDAQQFIDQLLKHQMVEPVVAPSYD